MLQRDSVEKRDEIRKHGSYRVAHEQSDRYENKVEHCEIHLKASDSADQYAKGNPYRIPFAHKEATKYIQIFLRDNVLEERCSSW